MYMTIWISNQTIPWMTKLAEMTGSLQGGGRVAALDQGGSPITYIFTQLFVKENLSGAGVIAAIYVACLAFTVYSVKKQKKTSMIREGEKAHDETLLIGD